MNPRRTTVERTMNSMAGPNRIGVRHDYVFLLVDTIVCWVPA